MESSAIVTALPWPVPKVEWVFENGKFQRYPEVPLEIKLFAASRNMEVIQVNGQRILRQKQAQKTVVPPGGCEIFVGKLPRLCLEYHIVPRLEEIGPIYEFRLMMTYSGANRGYAYAKFYNQVQAALAVKLLNDCEIQDGYRIGVTKSVDNCRLLLTGIPFYKTEKEIHDELYPIFPGLQYVLIEATGYAHFVCPEQFRFAIVGFADHRLAAMARTKIIRQHLRLWGYRVHVDWAEPETSPRVTHYYHSEVLEVSGLSRQTSNDQIMEFYNQHSTSGVSHVKRKHDKAFIYFKTRSEASAAMRRTNRTEIDGHVIRVRWFNASSVPFSKEQMALKDGTLRKTECIIAREQKTMTTLVTTSYIHEYESVHSQPPWSQPGPFYYHHASFIPPQGGGQRVMDIQGVNYQQDY